MIQWYVVANCIFLINLAQFIIFQVQFEFFKNDMVVHVFDLIICPFFRSVAMFNTMMQFC